MKILCRLHTYQPISLPTYLPTYLLTCIYRFFKHIFGLNFQSQNERRKLRAKKKLFQHVIQRKWENFVSYSDRLNWRIITFELISNVRYTACHPLNYLMKKTQLYLLALITTYPQKQIIRLFMLNLEVTITVFYTNLLTYQRPKYHFSAKNMPQLRYI